MSARAPPAGASSSYAGRRLSSGCSASRSSTSASTSSTTPIRSDEPVDPSVGVHDCEGEDLAIWRAFDPVLLGEPLEDGRKLRERCRVHDLVGSALLERPDANHQLVGRHIDAELDLA